MKRTGCCPKCQGREIAHLPTVGDFTEFSGVGGGSMSDREGRDPAPRRLALHRIQRAGWLGETVDHEPVAETEAYVCVACGYLEEYVKEPGQVPWREFEGATLRSG
jgi:hypothetical protein